MTVMILNFRHRGAAMITRSLKRLCWKLTFKHSKNPLHLLFSRFHP